MNCGVDTRKIGPKSFLSPSYISQKRKEREKVLFKKPYIILIRKPKTICMKKIYERERTVMVFPEQE